MRALTFTFLVGWSIALAFIVYLPPSTTQDPEDLDDLKLVSRYVSLIQAAVDRDIARLEEGTVDPPIDPPALKPNKDNTGLTDPSVLVASGKITVTSDGALIENFDVTGWIDIRASNVTVRNCRVTSPTYFGIKADNGALGTIIEDCEITGSTSNAVSGASLTVRRVYVHDVGADAFKPYGDSLIEGCFATDLGAAPGAHADAVQMRSGGSAGGHVIIRGNNFDLQGAQHNACVIMNQAAGPQDDVLIEGNWFNGGNYTVYVLDHGDGTGPPTNVKLIDNRFGRDYKFGPLVNHAPDFIAIGNVWDDTGELMSINTQ